MRVLNKDGVVYGPDPDGTSVKAYTPQEYAQLPPRKMTLTPKTPTPPTIEILPLSVSILEAKWRTILGGVEGIGRGNIHERDSVVAFTFTTNCEGELALTTEGIADRGGWNDQFHEWLRVVGQGDDGAPGRHCNLRIKLQKKSVYLKNYSTGEVTTLTQEEFKALGDKRRADRQGQAPATQQ